MSIEKRLARLESQLRGSNSLDNLSDVALEARISGLAEQLSTEATGEMATICREAIETRKAGNDATAIDARMLAAIRTDLHAEGISI